MFATVTSTALSIGVTFFALVIVIGSLKRLGWLPSRRP